MTTFFTVKVNLNEEYIFNSTCLSNVLLSHIKKTLGAEHTQTIIDLASENGDVVDLLGKGPQYANKFLDPRTTYIVVRVVEDDSDATPIYTAFGEVGDKIKFHCISLDIRPYILTKD